MVKAVIPMLLLLCIACQQNIDKDLFVVDKFHNKLNEVCSKLNLECRYLGRYEPSSIGRLASRPEYGKWLIRSKDGVKVIGTNSKFFRIQKVGESDIFTIEIVSTSDTSIKVDNKEFFIQLNVDSHNKINHKSFIDRLRE